VVFSSLLFLRTVPVAVHSPFFRSRLLRARTDGIGSGAAVLVPV